MNKVTFNKIVKNKQKLHMIYMNSHKYKTIIPLLDEPYQLALQILEEPNASNEDLGKTLGISWQTVKQIRSALD